ncbi:probable E3 ubiquitin-protein ligase HERC4 isoform X2 [Tribolium castaneum]|uniref:probable E3 ubiquitin-protein ligase HERC4 isoform X2 n=1 Tax=Tribolium castaneum TaxID=7070 RepID=UPI00077DD8D7|nr:PREDICTED: probable E3 ubiquitin-protein ligase HERC4 isoform X2 [Tribolium castaneum]|eukprot:XP_015840693.1 PREDICTED: probable E3 ubiquitin-protein ligase HERC4 isoform X2 [Tribolium castaneum]
MGLAWCRLKPNSSDSKALEEMFGWGSTIHGELGLGGIEEEHVFTPKALDWFEAKSVMKAALGANHTLFLTKDGKVYSCGSNDYGQLGHDQPRKRPRPESNKLIFAELVSGLDAYSIINVACGEMHSLALSRWGEVFSWGSDNYGQLGHQLGGTLQIVPKLIKSLAKYQVVQIAAGQRHSVALTNAGEIFVWGANDFGQLGLGTITPYESTPTTVCSLSGIPFALIACGANHTFAVSKSGAVFGWGKNINGQLGLNDTVSKKFPTQLRTLRNSRVRFISCGDEFSTFLTLDGGVFSCGAGMYGQLGHGGTSNEILPRQVLELMGSTITQISCGRQHSLAFVPSRGRVYSYGLGGAGQLGLRKPSNASTPQVVLGPWVSPSGVPVVPNNAPVNTVINRIYAGGDHCFVSVTEKKAKIEPNDFRNYEPESQILTLRVDRLEPCAKVAVNGQVEQEILAYLEVVFKNLACWNASFLVAEHYYCTSKHHGVDMEEAERAFSIIAKIEHETIKELIWNHVVNDILGQLLPSPPDVETLRIYLVLPLYHEFNNPKQHLKLHKPFASALLKLGPQASKVVGMWWTTMSCDYFEHLIRVFKSVVSFILRNQRIPENKTVFYDPSLVAMLDTLTYLNKLNHSVEGLKVPYDTFYISDLCDYLDVRVDYVMWLTDPNTGKLFLCNYPFIFDAQAKTQLLETDQRIQMHKAMQSAAQQAVLSMLFRPAGVLSITQFLVLNVTRDHIVQDALRELSNVDPDDLKKPLRVKFCGEEAEDAGGVTKEFFLLLLKEILDPKYGMFKEYEETRALWFSENSFEEEPVYFLIGLICGLAIYNFTIIDLPFPLALYKKLLNEPVGLADLKGLSPMMANSLQSILDYNESDFHSLFDLCFEISRDEFGESRVVELKPNGSNIPVTQDNKNEYVNLYVDYIFNTSIKKQYDAFHHGFMKVCGGRVLQLFHSHELQAVVVGNENYDWHALEEVAEYKNGYTSSDKTIRWFWEVIHEMPLEDKKKFLLFLTGSDRIPLQGMKAIKIIIQPTTDDKYLPVAHTCFNLLDLPRYSTKEKLKYKLMQAIQQTQGFSLV